MCRISDYNEYYDQENENKLMKNDSEKLNAMAMTLKELLSRLLDKRKAAKRTKNVDVSVQSASKWTMKGR